MTKAVKKQEDTSIVETKKPARGFEDGVEQDDLIIPRAKLLQAMSPEIVDGVEGLRPGMIINSLTGEVLPEEFIPVFKFKDFIRFNPRSKDDPNFDSAFEPGGVIWKTSDPTDPRVEETKFGPNGEKPLATTFLNFFSHSPGSEMPVIISFAKTGYKAGKQLLSLCKFSGGDMFSKKYKLTSQKESNGTDTYYVLKVRASGIPLDTEFRSSELLWEGYSRRVQDIQVHDMGEETVGVGGRRPY